jgi:FAD/FMN-containing dehydrogenase
MSKDSMEQQRPSVQLAALARELDGEVILPGNATYDLARAVFYRGIDRRPAGIVQAAGAADVARTVRLAADTGLELAIRSGGHSVAGFGTSEGGIVLDLKRICGLEVDPRGRSAWAGTGLTAGEFTATVGAHGLAVGFGDAPSVGIGGITLGGGVGFLHRRYGLTVDSLMAAEVVTADGRLVRADAETHPDLFWGLRGGGGNFGVVTRLRFRLHEVADVVGGMLILPATPGVVTRFLAEAEAAPDEISGIVNVMKAPPMPMIPTEHHGQPVILALLVYAGPAAAGERALAPFRAMARPIHDGLQAMRYPALYEEPGEAPKPVAMAVQSRFMDVLDHATAEAVLDHLHASTAPMSVAQFRVLGGAVARVPVQATAFAHRDRRMMVAVAAAYDVAEAAPEHEAWVAGLAGALPTASGAYVGFLADEGADAVRAAYPGATGDRLRRVKATWDPANRFRLNQNVLPGSPDAVPGRAAVASDATA